MDASRARRAHSIFTAALELPHPERDAMIAASCQGDESLANRVRKLLAASDRDGDFLESPALSGRDSLMAPIPDSVGDYLVIRVLGVGGMSTVYEAVQKNPQRSVALKVMRTGLARTDALLRFRLEAETLANLHHPGIAQIYETGSTQLEGSAPSPFFAMELVKDALPLTEFSRRHDLNLRQRLTLFVTLCDAVLHGHQHGVIHRDLKPANVLVGGDGRVKVIDFGIARLTEAAPGGASKLTLQADSRKLLGTLNYMSPEQCLRPQNIDTRADVFSLGVMLYELVTDQLPHDLSTQSIPEAVRIIAYDEPCRAASICKFAVGDLDAIIAKAMNKDADHRYSGAGALAADIRRWLEHRPIEARPTSVMMHVQKFVRRNRWLAASLTGLAISLVGGAFVATWFAYEAGMARDAAVQRERELAIVSDFQESALRGIDVATMGDRLRASILEKLEVAGAADHEIVLPTERRESIERMFEQVNFTAIAIRSLSESVLERYAQSMEDEFAEQPLLRARLQQQLASTMNSLGLHAESEPVLRAALNTRRAVLGEDHEDTLQSLHTLGSLLSTLGRYDEALTILRDVYQRRAQILGPDHAMTLRAGSSLGGLYRFRKEFGEAEEIYAKVLAAQRRTLGDDDPDTLRTLNNLGVLYASQDKFEQAEECWSELLERRRRILGEDHPEFLSSLGNLGALLQTQGRFGEARPLIEQALAADRRRLGDNHATTLVSVAQLASLLEESGELADAEAKWRECLEGRTKTLGPESPATLRTLSALGWVLHLRGHDFEGRQLLSQAVEAQSRILGVESRDTLDSQERLNKISELQSGLGEPAR